MTTETRARVARRSPASPLLALALACAGCQAGLRFEAGSDETKVGRVKVTKVMGPRLSTAAIVSEALLYGERVLQERLDLR